MELECGCVDACCDICALAAEAGRPRLRPENANDWAPPDLNKLRGKKHAADRDADDGVPMLWFWQMEGRRWNMLGGPSSSFDLAKKAWRRLAASNEERSAESARRQERTAISDAQIQRICEERARGPFVSEQDLATRLNAGLALSDRLRFGAKKLKWLRVGMTHDIACPCLHACALAPPPQPRRAVTPCHTCRLAAPSQRRSHRPFHRTRRRTRRRSRRRSQRLPRAFYMKRGRLVKAHMRHVAVTINKRHQSYSYHNCSPEWGGEGAVERSGERLSESLTKNKVCSTTGSR